MARLTDEDREDILADFHTGQYSKNELSKKYKVSHTTINKITKGLEPKHAEKVSTLCAINTELANESFKEVSAIEREVSEHARRSNLVYSIQEKALKKANIMLDQVDTPNDLKTVVETVDKASITLKVSDRHAPKTEINNNNTNMQSDSMQVLLEKVSK